MLDAEQKTHVRSMFGILLYVNEANKVFNSSGGQIEVSRVKYSANIECK